MVTKNYAARSNIIPTGTITDASGAQTGADIIALVANPSRVGLYIANNGAAVMAVNFGAAAIIGGAGSIPVAANSRLDLGFQALPSEAVHVIGTAGQNYTIKEIT